MKIASLDVWTVRVQEIVRDALLPGYEIDFADSYDPAHQTALVAGADIVLTGWAAVTEEMIRAAPRLRLIQKWGIGVDRIDLDAAARANVAVAIAAGSNANPVAEHTVMLMLAVYRRLAEVDRSMREGRWIFEQMRDRCHSLRGKTVGLVGFGNIGQTVARKLAGFEVKVIYHDTRRLDPAREAALGATWVHFEQVLDTSDIVSLHRPGGTGTTALIDAAAMARMKPGAILINTARGDLVDEAALCQALECGHLMGAGLDVFAQEPPHPCGPLTRFDQVVLTPHTAGSVIDNIGPVAAHVFGTIDAILHDRPIAEADRVLPRT